jgi:hypothetical protein
MMDFRYLDILHSEILHAFHSVGSRNGHVSNYKQTAMLLCAITPYAMYSILRLKSQADFKANIACKDISCNHANTTNELDWLLLAPLLVVRFCREML